MQTDEKIAARAVMIYCAGHEPPAKSAALLVLMAALDTPLIRALANTAKHARLLATVS
jgi:hypothetical protein